MAEPGHGWSVDVDHRDGAAHVRPVQDLTDHPYDDCPCGPTTEPVVRPDGSCGWLVVHHSLDGREAHEPAKPAD